MNEIVNQPRNVANKSRIFFARGEIPIPAIFPQHGKEVEKFPIDESQENEISM